MKNKKSEQLPKATALSGHVQYIESNDDSRKRALMNQKKIAKRLKGLKLTFVGLVHGRPTYKYLPA